MVTPHRYVSFMPDYMVLHTNAHFAAVVQIVLQISGDIGTSVPAEEAVGIIFPDYDYGNRWTNLAVLVAFALAFRGLTYLTLKHKSPVKR